MDEQGTLPNPSDALRFIRENMRIAPVPLLPEIQLYTAHPASGLWRLAGLEADDPPPPYWAYQWAGGAVLARHFLDRPETVRDCRVLDLGAGSGVVGIAAAKAGASQVIAAEIDPHGAAAIGLNAALNEVSITVLAHDLTGGPPPTVDLVAVGDLFYEHDLARQVETFLDRCLAAGIEVLIGDPGREFLPRSRLRVIAQYRVPDFGLAKGASVKKSAVFSFERE